MGIGHCAQGLAPLQYLRGEGLINYLHNQKCWQRAGNSQNAIGYGGKSRHKLGGSVAASFQNCVEDHPDLGNVS